MGDLALFMNDLYPNMYGKVETSTAVQPDEAELITEQDDQDVAEAADNGTAAGSTRRNLFLAFLLLVIISVIMGLVK